MKMYATNQKQLIDLVRQALDVETNYMIAKCLGISQSAMNKWYNNQGFPSDYFIFFLCDVADLDAPKTLAFIREEEAKAKGKEKEEKFWHKMNVA